MKFFKLVSLAAVAGYLLSVTACRGQKVEVIPGGLDPVGKLNSQEVDVVYTTNRLAAFEGFFSL